MKTKNHRITEKQIEDFALLLKQDLKDKFKTEMHLKSTEFNEILKDILKHSYKKETDIYILNTYLKSLKKFMNIIQSENSHYDIDELLSKISSNLSSSHVDQNNMLMRIGDNGDYFYIILSGAVGVLVTKIISIHMSQEQYIQHLKILYNNEPYLFEGTLKLHSKSSYFINLDEIKQKDEHYSLTGKNKPKNVEDYISWINGEKITDNTSIYHNEVKIMGYFKVTDLTQGNSFGEIALIEQKHKRTASIYVTEDSFFGRLSANDYKKTMKKIQEKIKRENTEFVFNTQLFNKISLKLFSQSYWNYFINRKITKGDYLFKEGHERDEIYFIQEGEIKIKTNLTSQKIENIFSSLIPNYNLNKKKKEIDQMGKNNEIILSYGKKGNILGMGDLLYEGRYYCDAICDSLNCNFFAIDIQIFLSIAKIFEGILESYNKLEEKKKNIMINRINTIKFAYQNTLLGEKQKIEDGLITKSGKEIKFQDWFDADKNFIYKNTNCKRQNVYVNVDKLKEKNFMPPINSHLNREKRKNSLTIQSNPNKTISSFKKFKSSNLDENKNLKTMLITTYESQSINPSLVKFNATRPKLNLDKKKMYEKKNNSNIYNSIENKIRNNKRSQTSIKRNEDEIIEEILNGDRKYVLRLLKKESKVNKPVLLNHIDMSYQNSIIKKPNSNKSKSSVTLANIGLSIQKNLIGKRNITNY